MASVAGGGLAVGVLLVDEPLRMADGDGGRCSVETSHQ
jgi:hypothetical protein